MQVHVTARHLNLTPAINDYLTKKINRLERYYDHLVWSNVILWVEKTRHVAEVVVHSPLHTLRAKESAGDLYAAIDLVVDKVERQLKKLKEKQRASKRVRAAHMARRGSDGYFDSSPVASLGTEGAQGAAPWPHAISVVKQVPVKPMNVQEAIHAMESLGYTFWMFLNKTSRKFNVIFRRTDQTYGLLEPSSK